MTINKFNYEAFALDYLEGNLSPEMVEEMEFFLKTHPAIESELSGMMEFVTLEANTSIVYEEKEALLKPERIVWLQKRWIRPLMMAASFALLLMTYFMGYQAGTNNGEGQVVVENGNFNGNGNNESLGAIKEGDKIEKINKETTNEQVVATTEVVKQQSITSQKNRTQIIAKTVEKPLVIEEKTIIAVNEISNHPTEKIPVLATNPVPLDNKQKELKQVEEIMAIALTSLASTNLMRTKVSSTTNHSNDLTNILAAELPLDKAKLAQQLKRKRTFKDFLGKFPVNNLREALIPSYYREESTGQ